MFNAHWALLLLGSGNTILEKALGRIPARLGGPQCVLVMLADTGDVVLWLVVCVRSLEVMGGAL